MFTPNIENEYEETVDVIAAFALAVGKGSEKELLRWNFDFLGLFDVGDEALSVRYLEDSLLADKRGVGESYFKEVVGESIDSEGNLRSVRFVMNEEGYIDVEEEVASMTRKGGKSLRRFFLVDFQDEYFITTVSGLNEATLHYKDGSDRNAMGLQFDDIVGRHL